MRLTREFYTPKTFTKVIERPELDSVVYFNDDRNGFFGVGFSGKRAKPDFNYKFKSSEERETYLEKRYFGHLQEILKIREERKASAKNAAQKFLAELKPGTILSDSWGYEQTQVEFYQVVERKGSKVQIQEMGQITEPGSEGRDCCRVMPGAVHGPKIWKVVRGQSIKIDTSISLTVWDGKSSYKSWYY